MTNCLNKAEPLPFTIPILISLVYFYNLDINRVLQIQKKVCENVQKSCYFRSTPNLNSLPKKPVSTRYFYTAT